VILYLAESSMTPKQLDRLADKAGANNFLFSFAFPRARSSIEHFCLQPYRRIFVDSGAFSAWTKGKKVDLGQYIAFCKHIIDVTKCPVVFAALDVIPGSKHGPNPTGLEIAKACDEGWDNYQTMKQEGVSPCLMTYHDFEHVRYLKRIADDSDYFAVAPRKSKEITTDIKLKFLEDVFGYIQGSEGSVRKKIHGFGVSSVPFMERFPFYTVDTTAWEQSIRSGLYRHTSIRDRRANLKLKDLDDGVSPDLRELLGLRGVAGEKVDQNGNSGTYFLAIQAMKGDVLLQRRITDLWQRKGVIWDDQPRECGWPDVPCNPPCTRCLEGVQRFAKALQGE
jgi:hypothetical protein